MQIPTHAKVRLAGHARLDWLYSLPAGLTRDLSVLVDLTPYAGQLGAYAAQIGDELGDVAGIGLWPAIEVAPALGTDQTAGEAIDAESVTIDVHGKRVTWSRTVVSIELDGAVLERDLHRAIDAAAERCREQWITPGSGQAMSYQKKAARAAEAKAILDGNGALDAEDPRWVLLASEVGITAETVAGVVLAVCGREEAWEAVEAVINGLRLGAKKAVTAEIAGNHWTAARAIPSGIVWPSP